MHKVAFCSVLHQPWRIKRYDFFEIKHHNDFFNNALNERLFKRISKKSYIPTLKILKDLCEDSNFKVNLSITGTFFEQARSFSPRVIHLLKQLNDTEKLEFISETYYHSLAFLISKEEFKEQILKHKRLLKTEFNQTPKVFRNTESFYNDDVARAVEKFGFKGIITEGSEKILGWRSPGFPYRADDTKLQLFMRNYKLSDDIAFRFSARSWSEWPLTAEKYAKWLNSSSTPFTLIFIDFETFGEHQWEDTGIFEFLKYLPREKPDGWVNLSELLTNNFVDSLHTKQFISWADTDRDLSAWLGNDMQRAAFRMLASLEKPIKQSGDKQLLEVWRKLTTSDHLYYMSTKYAGDEEVHSYFREEAHPGPYEAFTNFVNILQDLRSMIER